MHVVSGLRANLGQQRAVNPVYNRSIHFTGSAKSVGVFLEFRYENVLYLQVSARVQQLLKRLENVSARVTE